jgi:integrase
LSFAAARGKSAAKTIMVGGAMGRVKSRTQRDGSRVYYAYYRDLAGRERYLRRYTAHDEADLAWRTKEYQLGRGFVDDVAVKGRMTFEDYVNNHFFTTWRPGKRRIYSVRKLADARFIPFFGPMPIGAISRETCRIFFAELRDEGLQDKTIQSYRADLATIFNRAVDDGYRDSSPTARMRLQLRIKPTRIHPPMPEDFEAIYNAMPGPFTQMMTELAVGIAVRFGELTELRVRDVDEQGGVGFIRVQRAVSDVGPDGPSRFEVLDLTKGGDDRRLVLQADVFDRLLAHIECHGLGEDDLLFPLALLDAELAVTKDAERRAVLTAVVPDGLGRTAPNARGKTYPHGAMSGYIQGRCRCEWCRLRMAQWNANRPSRRRDLARVKRNITGHVPSDTFRNQVWYPTLESIGMPKRWVVHELRHAYGTWALAGGANIVDVQADYGHKQLTTTQNYVHAVAELRRGASDAAVAFRSNRIAELRKRRLSAV